MWRRNTLFRVERNDPPPEAHATIEAGTGRRRSRSPRGAASGGFHLDRPARPADWLASFQELACPRALAIEDNLLKVHS